MVSDLLVRHDVADAVVMIVRVLYIAAIMIYVVVIVATWPT